MISDLIKCFKSDIMVNTLFDPHTLMPNTYTYSSGHNDLGFRLLSGGSIHIDVPFSFSFSTYKCLMLIYTFKGGGTLSDAINSYDITDGKVLLFDCTNSFALKSIVLPWTFDIFFIVGQSIEFYNSIAPNFSNCLSISNHPSISLDLASLINVSCNINPISQLEIHHRLTNILHIFSANSIYDSNPSLHQKKLPHYLAEMMDHINNRYKQPFSLSLYEDMFKINKYRLCREFSKEFGISPLKALNKKRIDVSKEMLLTTEYNIQEISSIIGYENVNHYINLFKKENLCTPKAFRQKEQLY